MPKQIILGGLSGSGKDTARNILLSLGMVRRGVTCTTRTPRPGEVNGVDYDFMTPDEFAEARGIDELAEETVYIGNPIAYGITWTRVVEARASHLPTCWILDTTGVKRMHELFPGEVVSIFLHANMLTLADRMKVRGETNETVQRRLKRYGEELALGLQHFDHAIDTTALTPAEVVLKVLELCKPIPQLYKEVM